MAPLLNAFQFVLLTFLTGLVVIETSKCNSGKIGSKRSKISKKMAGGKTAANDTYKYAARMRLRLDPSLKMDDENNAQCTGTFVSFSNSETSKCGVGPTKYYFITAGHCFKYTVVARNVHYGLSKKSSFFTIRIGSARLEFEQLRNNLPITNVSKTNCFAKYIIVDTAVSTVRIPINYRFNPRTPGPNIIHADAAFIELTNVQKDKIIAQGGEFINGDTNAYTQDITTMDECIRVLVISMTGDAVFRGAQTALVKPAAQTQCLPGYLADVLSQKIQFQCLEIQQWISGSSNLTTYSEPGDSGGPLICKKGTKEFLMTHLSMALVPNPTFTMMPPRSNLRNLLQKVYYDDAVYNYFPPDSTNDVFVASEQSGYKHDELKR